MSTRRQFLAQSAAGGAAATLNAARPESKGIAAVEHIHVHGNRITYCGHPRQGGLFDFGDGELVVIHNHAPCAYQRPEDVQHDHGGYHGRSVFLLQRSTDSGRTWPGENDVEIWDETVSRDQRENFLLSSLVSPRDEIDLAKSGAVVVFPRTYLGPIRYGTSQAVSFALRSPDKGRTWERVPTLLIPPPGCYASNTDNTPIVRLPDKTLLIAVRTSGRRPGVDLYASSDSGLSWRYRSHICDGQLYPTLVMLKDGRLQCYFYPLGVTYSDDGGKTWSSKRIIVPRPPSPWLRDDRLYGEELAHRSPLPMLLRDGRVILLFARRISEKRGIGLMVSEDRGTTWTPDIILRDDAGVTAQTKVNGAACDYGDMGYPLATELEDGRIFTAYYYVTGTTKLPYGPPRYIAGSYFRLS